MDNSSTKDCLISFRQFSLVCIRIPVRSEDGGFVGALTFSCLAKGSVRAVCFSLYLLDGALCSGTLS